MEPDLAVARRRQKAQAVLSRAQDYQAALDEVDHRRAALDQELIEAHGDRTDGLLSYAELAGILDPERNGGHRVPKLSRGRIVQIVQRQR